MAKLIHLIIIILVIIFVSANFLLGDWLITTFRIKHGNLKFFFVVFIDWLVLILLMMCLSKGL